MDRGGERKKIHWHKVRVGSSSGDQCTAKSLVVNQGGCTDGE